MQALAWGIGGATAVTAFAIISVGAVGMAGFGMQGLAMGLYSLGKSLPIVTTLWVGGIATNSWAAAASIWLWSGQTLNPIYSNPASVANSRTSTLQAALNKDQQGRVVMATGVVEDSLGTRQAIIGTSEPRGYIRPTVKALLNPGEIVIPGYGHAEENIINWALANNRQVIAVGAGRLICSDCANLIELAGGIIASPVRPR